jgi:hypothetical protein
MLLFFLPPIVQALIGVAMLVAGVALQSVIIAGIGVLGLAVGGARYVRSRRRSGFQR